MTEITELDLERMRNMDVREVDPSTVPDINDIQIDTSLPPAERMASVLQQMNGNSYFYRSGNLLVKTTFKGNARLQTILEDCLKKL